MLKSKIHRTWDIFLYLISESDKERDFLEKIFYKQMKKIENFNKKIISSIAGEEDSNEQDHLNSEEESDENNEQNKKANTLFNKFSSIFQKNVLNEIKEEKEELGLGKLRKKIKKKLNQEDQEAKKKKFRFTTYLDENGEFVKNQQKLKKGFYDDLNYGDMAIIFNNNERKINSKLKMVYQDFPNSFKIFKNKINIISTLKEFQNDFLSDEMMAFYNALWFFSTDFYAKITPGSANDLESRTEKEQEVINLIKDNFQTRMKKEELVTGEANWILETKKDIAEKKYPDFKEEIETWKYIDDQEYKQVQKQKLLYKERIFIKFLRIALQQKKKITNQEIIDYLSKACEKELKKMEIKVQRIKNQKKKKDKKEINNTQDKKERKQVITLQKQHLTSKILEQCRDLSLFDVNIKDKKKCRVLDLHFQSLIRKIIIVKLNHMKIATRCFNSSDFRKIFLVLKIQKSTLAERAEIENFPKQFELGLVDLVSFDPLDSTNRPYRMKKINFLEYDIKKTKVEAEIFDTYQNSAKTDFSLLQLNGGNMKSLTKIIINLEEYTVFDLYNLLNIKLIQFKGLIDQLLKRTQNNIVLTRIVKDKMEKRKTWHSFVLYMLLFKYYNTGIKKLYSFNKFYKFEGLIYRLIATKALKDTNQACSRRLNKIPAQLESLWEKLKLRGSYAPYAKYIGNKKLRKYWRRFEINELGEREVFLQKDRLQVLMSFLTKAIKLDELLQEGLVIDYFCLDDDFIKFGKSKLPFFINILDIENILKKRDSHQNKTIREFLELFQDTADESDFLEQSLKQDLKFRFLKPWENSIDTIRDYYGEKIAIYFSLLTFYSKAKIIMALVGLVIYIMQQKFLEGGKIVHYKITTTVYSFLILCWVIFFSEFWKRRQSLFAMRYGQADLDINNKKNIRPGFEGYYIRNVDNNEMNVLYYSSKKRSLKYFISYSISLFIVILSIACSLALLYWKTRVDPTDVNMFYLITIINTIQIIVFEIVYKIIAVKLNDFENHSTSEAYRDSLILKLFVFQFFNNFNSLVLIAFVKAQTTIFGVCSQSYGSILVGVDCFNELTIQVEIIFISQFCFSFLKILIPILFILKRKVFKLIESKWKIKNYPWKTIDRHIEKESVKDNYITALQVDGTLLDILKLLIQLAFLSLFSLSFPFAFLIAAIGGVLDIRMEVFRFLTTLRRPIPEFAKDIGLWQTILEFIILLAIFCNSAIISFTLKGVEEQPVEVNIQFRTFIIIIIIFLAAKYIVTLFINAIPANYSILKQRHERIRDSFENLDYGNSGTNLRAGVNLNIYHNLKEEIFNDDED